MKKTLFLSFSISILLNLTSIAVFAQTSVDVSTTTNVSTTASTTIAYMQMDEIVKSMPEYNKAISELDAYTKKQQQHLKNKAEAIKKYEQGIYQQKQAGTLSPLAEQEAQQKSQKLRQGLEKDKQTAQRVVQQKELELMQPIEEKFGAALDAVAKANNYAYIADAKVFLYLKGGVDATELIKKQLTATP